MTNKEKLLQRAIALNKDDKYQEVDDLLTDESLEKYNDAALYAEKVIALQRMKNYEESERLAKLAFQINPNDSKINQYFGNLNFKNKNFKKAEAYYKKVIILDPKYTAPYLALGNLYNESVKYDKAEEYFKKVIEIEPNMPSGYNSLGNFYLDRKEFLKAEYFYKEAIERDKNFSNAYNGLANLYFDSKEHEKAENFYKKAIELDEKSIYPYNGLANLYLEKREYEKAEDFYKKAIELDEKYSYPYNGLGNLYRLRKEYEKAEVYYKKAIELDENFSYPYNGLGNLYSDKEYEKAKFYYKKAIELKKNYSAPYYNLGRLYYEKKDFKEARENYLKKLDLANIENDYFSQIAKSRIEEIDSILESKQYEKITTTVSKIKELLCFKKGLITHYTGISIAKFLIIDETQFRLSEGAFLNDTSEGTILFDYLDFDTSTHNNCGPNASVFSKKPFIGSFVNQTKNNDLTLWRMYGKENLEEAKGCAITIDIDELKESIKQKLKTRNDGLKDFEELEFYKVAYLDNNKFTFSEAKPVQVTKLNSLMKELQSEVIEFKDKPDKKPHETLKIIELLNEVAYLFKNAEYQYENEVRLVMKDAIGFDKIIDTTFTHPKVYVELVSILPMIKQITIGPKVERADEWAAAFHYQFLKKDLRPEISISNLPFK